MLNRFPKGGLLLAGLAAYAYYKYNKMSDDQKRDLVSNLKQKGQKLYNDYVPENVKSMISKTSSEVESKFCEGSAYTS